MAQFHVERHQAVRLAGVPVEVTLDTLGERVGAVFDDVERRLRQAGVPFEGAGVLRYGMVSRSEPFVVDVAFEVPAGVPVPDPLQVTVTPVGMYVVARQYGAYSWIGGLTKELMDWGDQQGLDYAMIPTAEGDVWECWLESYPQPPVNGPEGLEGPVEIFIKVA